MVRRFTLLSAGLLLVAAHLAGQGERTYPAARQGGNYMQNYYFAPAPSSTPWAPAWSPDGSALAVAMSGSIWTIDRASGSARELTYNRKYHSMPDWSPDGRWIAYVADDGGRTIQLEIVNVATGESRALTSDDQIYMDPVFSPDGTRLAYVATKPRGNFNVLRCETWRGTSIGGRSRVIPGRSSSNARAAFAWSSETKHATAPKANYCAGPGVELTVSDADRGRRLRAIRHVSPGQDYGSRVAA